MNFDIQQVKNILQKQTEQSLETPSSTLSKNLPEDVMGYRILDKMGRGGTAVVFKAENATGDIVALKLLYPGLHKEKKIAQQFVNEGMILLKLNHPNIIKGYDFGIFQDMYFLALELIEGESLESFMNQGLAFTERYTFELALQVAKALAYLEKKGMIHRDVKPANLLFSDSGIVKLSDFAFAIERSQLLANENKQNDTCGTVEYMSPEQARGYTDLDIRSDVYSLGITCFHMLTGHVPFSDEDPREVMRCQIYEEIEFDNIPNISKLGKAVLRMMLEKNKHKRAKATQLVPILEKVLKRLL